MGMGLQMPGSDTDGTYFIIKIYEIYIAQVRNATVKLCRKCAFCHTTKYTQPHNEG